MEAAHALLRAVAVAAPPGSTLQASRLEDGGLSMVRSDAAPRGPRVATHPAAISFIWTHAC